MVTAACIVSRPMQGSGGLITHWGVVLVTNQGDWLIHSTPGYGVVVTEASNMSNKWSAGASINVKSGKTIRGCLRSSGGASGSTESFDASFVNYCLTGTCKMARNSVVEYLSEENTEVPFPWF